MKNNISATIIAGGKGSRFGKPKYDIKFGDKRLIDIAIELAGNFSNDISVACGVIECKLPPSVIPLKDIFPGCGPLGGIYTALYHSKKPWILVMPVDMPLLSAGVYDILIRQLKGECPVAAVSKEGLEPLVSVWPVSAVKTVEGFIKRGNYSIRKCLKTLEHKEVIIDELFSNGGGDFFYNINTQQDLRQKTT